MYDKVKLFHIRTRTTPDISEYLDSAKEQTDLSTGEVNTFGSIGGLRVCSYTGGISVVGSLAKYLYGSNVYPLDAHTTAQAIEKLSDALHLDLSTAKVTGLEFGTHFVMRKPVGVYLRKLGDMPRLLRYQFNAGTLYYKHKGKQQPKVLCFYDKNQEADEKGSAVPAGMSDANLLRYEMRLKGHLPKQLGVAEVTASSLQERAFYRMLVQRWQEYYFTITKSKQIQMDAITQIRNVKDAFNVFVARLISQSDKSQIAAFLDELKDAKTFDDRKCYSRLKQKINEVASSAKVCTTDEDMQELDGEIKNAGAYA